MSEELLGGSQTAEPTQEPVTTETTQTQEPVTTQEPNYFEIKYNKEPVKVSYEEAPTYIQKGMNYDKLQEKYQSLENDPSRSFVESLAAQYNMTAQEYIQAVEQQRQAQMYEEAGIDPDTFNNLLDKHPDVQFAREMRAKQSEEVRFQQEANEFFQEFPDMKPEQIPAEVWQVKEQRGLSLLDAYLRVSYKSLGQQKEQEAIQKLQQNAQSTPGSLGAGAEHKTGYSNLSAQDKKALRERVLRGETIEL